jgi:serine/threonine protein kinase
VERQGTAVLDRGTRLGKYEIERLVGVGSMGAVYEGVHRATGERFAIKVLSPLLAAVPAARARFLKEAKLTERVRHPHIINVTDVGEDGGHSYLVMEMLEGADLSSRLDGFGSLAPAETVDIMLPVCDAVAEAHACGVTHRDLKPSNIFLAVRDGKPRPVVVDFGIAKDEDAASTWDGGGAGPTRRPVFGTPYYLAPEQIVDHRAAGPASDQHALGVILYECLTGQPPYRGDSVEKLFRAITAGKPIPPSTREPDLPDGLDAVVLRALETEPNKRFESVAELGRALRPFASKSAVAVPGSYQRKPSSPAIEVEASTPSPFRRTLTPEVETLSEPWFEAAETQAPQDGAEAVALPALESTTEPEPDAEPPLWTQAAPRKLAAQRIWIGAAAGVVVAVLALVLVATRGSSSAAHSPQATPPPPAEVVVHAEPAAVKPTAPPPVPATPPAAATAPVPVPEPVTAVAEEPPPAPSTVPAAAGMARARKSADRPRARASDGIRMHNGVPLLD